FTISGTTEPGASVAVTLGAAARTATADAAGAWQTAPFTALELPLGPAVITLTAVATDAAGNPGAPLNRNIQVEELPLSSSPVGNLEPLIAIGDPVQILA